MLIALLIISLTLTIDLLTDLKQWGRINHIRGWLLRLPSFAVATWLDPKSALLWLVYWVVFDAIIGIVKYRNIFAVGTTSFLDRHIPVWLKWGMGAGGMGTYLIL